MSLKQLLKFQHKNQKNHHSTNKASYVISDLTSSIRAGRRIHQILVNRGIYKSVLIRNRVFYLLKRWHKFTKSPDSQLFCNSTNLTKHSQAYQKGYLQGITDARTQLFMFINKTKKGLYLCDQLGVAFIFDELEQDEKRNHK